MIDIDISGAVVMYIRIPQPTPAGPAKECMTYDSAADDGIFLKIFPPRCFLSVGKKEHCAAA